MDTNRVPLNFYFALILNFIFGNWLRVQPFKLRGFSSICATCLVIVVNGYCLLVLILVIFNFIQALAHFQLAIYIALGVLGTFQGTFRTVVFGLKRKAIEETIKKFQQFININKGSQEKQKRLISKALCYSYKTTAIYSAGLIINMTIHFTSMWCLRDKKRLKHVIDAVTVVEKLENETTLRFILHYLGFLMGFGKTIAIDHLFHVWYAVLIEEFDLLIENLQLALRQTNPKEAQRSLNLWLKFHHEFMRLMQRVNAITSPVVILTVATNVLQMCLLVYSAVKNPFSTINTIVLFSFALLALFQSFVYCNFGQKIRERVNRLQETTYMAPWLKSRRGSQHAALMICANANERTMPLPGAPFFSLSLEFFASIMGAVFTYFIVLFQLK